MADTRQGERERRDARTRDRLGALLVVLLAIVAGLVAAYFATPKPWQHQTVTAPTPQAGS